jgi:hypothetical protein
MTCANHTRAEYAPLLARTAAQFLPRIQGLYDGDIRAQGIEEAIGLLILIQAAWESWEAPCAAS